MEDFLRVNGSSEVMTTTTTESQSSGTITTTTCGSNGSPLVTRCYRNNYCSTEEPLVKPKNEVSLVNTTLRTKCCGSGSSDELPAAKNCSNTSSNENSEHPEGATSISDTNYDSNTVKMSSPGVNSSESVQVTHKLMSKETAKEVPSFPTHYSYLSVSLVSTSPRTQSIEGQPSPRASYIECQPFTRQLSPRLRYPEETLSRNFHPRRISQSRPSSPPPATYFPPPRRPSLSLPPSPQSARIHRVSLPSNAFLGLSLPSSANRSVPSSTHSSPSTSRPRTPTPPPINRRSPRRRSARTPSPRPPLPPQASNEPPVQPQQPLPPPPNRSRQQECQPYKMRMRSR